MKVIFAPYSDGNPYQKELIKELELKGVSVGNAGLGFKDFFKTIDLNKADVIHFHWLDTYILGNNSIITFIKIIVFLLRLKLFKKSKKYIWTAHNLKSHESSHPLLEKFFLKNFVKILDRISVHSLFAKDKLMKEYGANSDKIQIIPHANYINAYPVRDDERKLLLKNKLEIDNGKFTFMFLGNIRPYKGVLEVISAFKELNFNDAQLVICGSVKAKDEQKLIEKKIDKFSNIKLIAEYINDEDISSYLDLADAMLYPYKDILTSGGLLLGMSYKKVCIASNVGSMSEFLDSKFLFNTYLDLKETMKEIRGFSEEELKLAGELNYSRIKDDTWKKMADLTLNLYS
ncbi:glycosyltransferase [Flavobacterium sp. 5]|uniref:glycosyltransferase n=1 Tax=Flavobacterium sp. 5 TaxID=2035199 RepID=UPI000C2CA352|nr:glycosyltransferase [Flavobacterium sp. 5]PKB17428.1 glycosyltransferase involved in cell wall biosynthesis [Flavobacterium sp. 5]